VSGPTDIRDAVVRATPLSLRALLGRCGLPGASAARAEQAGETELHAGDGGDHAGGADRVGRAEPERAVAGEDIAGDGGGGGEQHAPGDLPAEPVGHQAGRRHVESAQAHYLAAGVDATVTAFVDDMAEAYGWADLVICRSGALTVAELAAAGVASVLVPFPHAVDDHQTANAQFLSDAGAALLCQQRDLSAERLAEQLQGLMQRSYLLSMAEAAHHLAKADATALVVETVLRGKA